MYSSCQTAQNVRLPYETTGRNIDPNIGNSDRWSTELNSTQERLVFRSISPYFRAHFSSNLRPDCVKQRKAQISLDQR
ncbi:hypothetical protein NEOLEDRAFT_1128108 [Neolentinus lepideus HHB14362 ss-1]|uniref:Uncharacterized protein n=1 Tax=Neolentinus lepideus HHB14362 ss-1 TaxID=1314782 RepID=A0A165V9T6_9AGAM|nr:hypothetical protein NEOLEDRAFT_1128108 [Neolentinus lepideus HHB14362 ss-1]